MSCTPPINQKQLHITFYSCNIGASSLPEMFEGAVRGLWEYISVNLWVPMLQLLLINTSKTNSLDANMSVDTVSFIYAHWRIRLWLGNNTIVTMILIINL